MEMLLGGMLLLALAQLMLGKRPRVRPQVVYRRPLRPGARRPRSLL